MLGAGMIVVCLMTGCANLMVAIYDNDIKIASNTNSYNLNTYEQTAEDGHHFQFRGKQLNVHSVTPPF